MLEKIKNRIKQNKNDKKVYNSYVKIFFELQKSKELFSEDENFNNLKTKEKDVEE